MASWWVILETQQSSVRFPVASQLEGTLSWFLANKANSQMELSRSPPRFKYISFANLSPFTASTPAIISLCPAINFVAECMTISAPSSNGWDNTGDIILSCDFIQYRCISTWGFRFCTAVDELEHMPWLSCVLLQPPVSLIFWFEFLQQIPTLSPQPSSISRTRASFTSCCWSFCCGEPNNYQRLRWVFSMLSCSFQFSVVAFVTKIWIAVILQVYLEMKKGFLLASLAASKTVREIANRWWHAKTWPRTNGTWRRSGNFRLLILGTGTKPGIRDYNKQHYKV